MLDARTSTGCAIVIGALVAGCGPAIQEARFKTFPAREATREIAVYQAALPECQFDEVGTITVKKRTFVSSQEMIDAMKSRAREMGGDAIVRLREGSEADGAIPVGSTIIISNRQTFTATVIRFKDEACTR